MSIKKKALLAAGIISLILVGGFLAWSLLQPATTNKHDNPSEAKPMAKPEVAVTVTESGRTIPQGTPLQATVQVSGDEIVKVVYEIDGVLAGVSYSTPFSMSLDTTNLSIGSHTLRVTAYNRAGQASQSQTMTFTVTAPAQDQVSPPAASSSSRRSATTPAASNTSTSGSSTGTTPPATPPAGPTPDTTPPSVPSNVQLSDAGNYHTAISWTASSDNVGVSGYEIWRDSSLLTTTTATNYTDTTTLPGHSYNYQVRASDSAGNQSAFSSVVAIAFAQITVFNDTDVPFTTSTNDSGSIELGMKFRASQDGDVTGVRFYKGVGNDGAHVGNVWSSTGTNLASVTFSGETADGWQTATFSSPVHITAGTVYVVSYFAPTGHYASTAKYFQVNHFSSPYVSGLESGDSGANGLYGYSGTSAFPTNSFNQTNYWVDVLFTPDTAAVYPVARTCPVWPALPNSSCTGVPSDVTLKTHTGDLTIEADGLVIDGYDIDGGITIQADNVIIRNSRIRGIINASTGAQTGLLVQDSELSPTAYTVSAQPPISDGNYTLLRTHVHKWQDGPRSSIGSVVIRDSISDDLMFAVAEHPDGYQQYGPGNESHVTLEHNILSGCAGNTADPGNSAIFWSDGPGAGSTLDAFHNSFRCGQYSVRINNANLGSGVNVNIHDNQIVRDSYVYGPYECNDSVVFNGTEGLQWSNNVYDDGSPVVFHGCP